MRDLRRKSAPRLIQARSNFIIGSYDLNMDLWSAALWTKRPSIFDGAPTLLAMMLHDLKLAHSRAESKTRDRAIG